jgi:hypothetical protein
LTALALAAGLASLGCGRLALEPATQELPLARGSAEPAGSAAGLSGLELLLSQLGEDPTEEVEGPIPNFEIYAGLSINHIGDKLAGTVGGTQPISWDDAFGEPATGFDVQVVFPGWRPPRPAKSLAAGDTFLIFHVTLLESYDGQVTAAGPTYDSMSLLGLWLDGRTVLNPLGAAKSVRPYIQYGGGLVLYPAVNRDAAANWDSTSALGFHLALGIEVRGQRFGLYAEGGVQTVAAPNLAAGAPIDESQAQDLLTYPVRLGLMMTF